MSAQCRSSSTITTRVVVEAAASSAVIAPKRRYRSVSGSPAAAGPHARQHLAYRRQQSGQLRGFGSAHGVWRAPHQRRECFDPRLVGHAEFLVAAAIQHGRIRVVGEPGKLRDTVGLADPRFARHHHELRRPSRSFSNCSVRRERSSSRPTNTASSSTPKHRVVPTASGPGLLRRPQVRPPKLREVESRRASSDARAGTPIPGGAHPSTCVRRDPSAWCHPRVRRGPAPRSPATRGTDPDAPTIAAGRNGSPRSRSSRRLGSPPHRYVRDAHLDRRRRGPPLRTQRGNQRDRNRGGRASASPANTTKPLSPSPCGRTTIPP